MNAIVSHLWSSTLVLLLALLVARWLPLTARTRYAVLTCGLAKFAIPSIAISAPLRLIGIDLANLGREAEETIAIQFLGGPVTLDRALPAAVTTSWPAALLVSWVVSAAALAAAWAIARRRLVAAALSAATEASPRERSALTAARRGLSLSRSIDVVRSTICEAPAVVRIIRPVVVLPDGGCDDLDDEELESLLRHECAHVARRDNLAGLFESGLVAAFWFHPLVWIAQRAIGTAREEACDETAAATSPSIDTYVSALTKICRAVLAPRLSGVSCMASAHLKERLNHIMRYESLRHRALSHRLVVAAAAVAVFIVAAATGLQGSPSLNTKENPYQLEFTVRPGDLPTQLEFSGRVRETASGLVLSAPKFAFSRGSSASVRTVADNREIHIDVRDAGGKVDVTMRVVSNGLPVQETTYSAATEPDGPRNGAGRRYTGQPISLDLKDAEIKDVLRTFSKLIGTDIAFPPTLEGRVTIKVEGKPWDQVFDEILEQQGLTYEIAGKSINIRKK